jgi:YfiH family protein
VTSRSGGVSTGPFGGPDGGGLNIGLSTGDDLDRVHTNRRLLQLALPAAPRWLRQVHGASVVDAAKLEGRAEADAAFTGEPNVVCVVSVADCVPVFLAEQRGRCVAVAHAGWRGLAAGVIQNSVAAMRGYLGDCAAHIVAWIGPAIGPAKFEVGAEVLQAMRAALPRAEEAFVPSADGKFLASLPALARQALAQVGAGEAGGGDLCTFSDPSRFYSFRRDRVTGRHAALIWLDE